MILPKMNRLILTAALLAIGCAQFVEPDPYWQTPGQQPQHEELAMKADEELRRLAPDQPPTPVSLANFPEVPAEEPQGVIIKEKKNALMGSNASLAEKRTRRKELRFWKGCKKGLWPIGT